MPETEMDYLGTGFKIINFPTWAIRNSDGVEEPQITEEASAYVQERMNFLRFERGKFISGCTEIDNVLGEAISAFSLENIGMNIREDSFTILLLILQFFHSLKEKMLFSKL